MAINDQISMEELEDVLNGVLTTYLADKLADRIKEEVLRECELRLTDEEDE